MRAWCVVCALAEFLAECLHFEVERMCPLGSVQAGCGFLLYPSQSRLPASVFNYTLASSPGFEHRDIVREFVDAARAAGIMPGIYYILNVNAFLCVSAGKVSTKCKPGSVQVTQEEYEDITLQQLTELWTNCELSHGRVIDTCGVLAVLCGLITHACRRAPRGALVRWRHARQ